MQYDLNLTANASQRIEAAGQYFKYKSGPGLIRVTTSKGEYVDMMPGQSVYGVQYSSLTIQDKSGAANVGVLLAGSFDFRDDTITGAVAIAEPYLSMVANKRDFAAATFAAPSAGQYPSGSLSNPAGSGKNLLIDAFYADHAGGANTLWASVGTYQPAGQASAGIVAKFGGAAVGVAKLAAENANVGGTAAAPQPGQSLLLRLMVNSAQLSTVQKFSKPVIVPPGYTFMLNTQNSVGNLACSFEFSEVPV